MLGSIVKTSNTLTFMISGLRKCLIPILDFQNPQVLSGFPPVPVYDVFFGVSGPYFFNKQVECRVTNPIRPLSVDNQCQLHSPRNKSLVCLLACLFACLCVCLIVCVCVCVVACLFVRLFVRLFVSLLICVCSFACLCVRLFICSFVCLFVFVSKYALSILKYDMVTMLQ